jgi:hypothetical protein
MKTDVIVTFGNQTVLFKTQNQRTSEWLRNHCNLNTENREGDTEMRVHPARCTEIVEDLKAAGFLVLVLEPVPQLPSAGACPLAGSRPQSSKRD